MLPQAAVLSPHALSEHRRLSARLVTAVILVVPEACPVWIPSRVPADSIAQHLPRPVAESEQHVDMSHSEAAAGEANAGYWQ